MRLLQWLFFLATIFYAGTSMADETRFGVGTKPVQSFQQANATCFIYEQNAYKCACSQIQSNKKVIWFDRPAEFFNGKLAIGTQYIFAERCR